MKVQLLLLVILACIALALGSSDTKEAVSEA